MDVPFATEANDLLERVFALSEADVSHSLCKLIDVGSRSYIGAAERIMWASSSQLVDQANELVDHSLNNHNALHAHTVRSRVAVCS